MNGTRQRWCLGNWKQNHLRAPAAEAAAALSRGLVETPLAGIQMGVAPSYLALDAVARAFTMASDPWLFAQDVAAQESGAFTGEVGPAMLREAGVRGVIVGHSERRTLLGETSELVAQKVLCALAAGLTVCLCVGEPLEVRDSGSEESFVISQLYESLMKVPHELVGPQLLIAYEPVWAIGTGRNATAAQASQMHGCLRQKLGERFGQTGADRSILYGGSVKPDNASALIAAGDIDGFLVGGASLDPRSFLAIAMAMRQSP